MRIAIVIPTLNAEKCGNWQTVLTAVAEQTVALRRKIIIDSSSDDATCAVARSLGWECRSIRRKAVFDHGKTRAHPHLRAYQGGTGKS